MTLSIWRYSHLMLAISSALFISIATLTGIVLAFEPISNNLQPYNSVNLNSVSISETIITLQSNYKEIITLEIDENDFVSASVITQNGKSESFYINPKNGAKVGEIIQKKQLFEFATNLHRSLFLKSTGRFLVGFFSFLLFLISCTGIILIVKRQGGFAKLFSKIVKENMSQYYHIILGRYFFLPILIITLTGVYLSLEKFSLLPKNTAISQNFELKKEISKLHFSDFPIFKSIKLSKVKKIEFPFSNDEGDYFFVQLNDKEIEIHQFTGQIVRKKNIGFISIFSNYSLFFHTGKGSVLWSLVLLLSCFAMLFFIFSGFSMTLKRRKNKSSIKNKFNKDEATYIILFGSETGSTFHFANTFFEALIALNKKAYLTELNSYTNYKKAKHLVVFTATYGDGEAPANARKFIKKIQSIPPKNKTNFSVVGFGSTNYPEFCKFAMLIHAHLQSHEKFTPILPLCKIDNQSFAEFRIWVNQWSSFYNLNVSIDEKLIKSSIHKSHEFKVIQKTVSNKDATFLLELKPVEKIKFMSGDLLSITLEKEKLPRLYSIAKIGHHILLSIKKHEFGVCSNYLNSLTKGDVICASIQKNEKFHFPKRAKEVVLIANGTGIAPFLGMIQQNKKTTIHLFWGGRTKGSLELYKTFIDKALAEKKLSSFKSVFSQEQNEKVYVQELLEQDKLLIEKVLRDENYIMICGSLNMQKGVLKTIEDISKNRLQIPLDTLKENQQIKTDCY